MTQPLFPSTLRTQSRHFTFLATKSMLRLWSLYLEKTVLAQEGGEGQVSALPGFYLLPCHTTPR